MPQQDPTYIDKLYGALQQDETVKLTISKDEFTQRIGSDDAYREKVYGALQKSPKVKLTISLDEFSQRTRIGEPPGKPNPDGTGATSGEQKPVSQSGSAPQQTGSRAFDPIKQYKDQKQPLPKVIGGSFAEQSATTPESTEVEQQITSRREEIQATPEAKELTRKEKEYATIKPVADQYRAHSSKRALEHNFPALQSEYERAGGLDKLRAEDNLDRAYKAVDEDYLDVLAATKPEIYQETKSHLDAIEQKKRDGKTLSDADEKFQVELRNKALSVAGMAEKATIHEIQRNANFEDYQKQTAELTIEAEKYKKEFDSLVQTIGQRPPTAQEKARMDELVKKSEIIAQKYDKAEQDTGVTPEVREALGGSYEKLASLAIAFDDNEKRYEVGLKKDINELRKDQRAERLKEGGIGVWADEFMRATTGAVSNSVQSLAQLPKVAGDLVGDTDYDWADELYNAAKNVKEETESEFGRPTDFDKMPIFMKVPVYLGEGVGSVTSLAGGGAVMGGGRIATMGAAFLTSEADYYQAALDAGATPKEAAQQATAIATVTSVLEGIIPDTKYFDGTKFTKSVITKASFGETFEQSLKKTINEYLPAAARYVKEVGKGGLKEGVEEGTQQLGEDVTKEVINEVAGKEYYTDTFNPDTYKEAMTIGGLTGTAFSAVSSLREKSPTQESLLFDAAGDRENIVAKIAQIDEDRAAEVDELLTEAEKMRKGWEKIPQFQKLSPEKQAHVVSESLRAKQLNKTAKEVGMADEATALEVESIEKEVAGLVRTGKTTTEITEEKAAEEAEKVRVEEEQKVEAEIEAQPETLTEEEIKVKESLGEKIYTAEDIDTMLQEDEVIERCPPGYVRTAKNGAKTGFKSGGTWEIVTEFKGKSHKEGGIDIEISGGRVKASNEDNSFKAEDGAYWQMEGAPQDPYLQETDYEETRRYGDQTGAAVTGVASAINPVVGGIIGAGMKVGGGIRNKTERTDESGQLLHRNRAKVGFIAGSILSPSKAFSQLKTQGHLNANKYLDSVEESARLNLPQEQEAFVPEAPSAMQQQQMSVRGEMAAMRQQAGIAPQGTPEVPMVGNGGMIAGNEPEVQEPQMSGGMQTVMINGQMYGYDSTGNFLPLT